ncbi:cupin domain-containing protein [Chiayiivirga flava]|nr:cupin domain-containing protein [Chiayiivirga flava]
MRVLRAGLCIALLGICSRDVSGATPARVFIAGDSTASTYGPERAPRTGWGQVLQTFLDPAAYEVRNHAQSGRSSRSFIEQGWLDGIDAELRAGDVLLIQFGHNDEKIEDSARYTEPREAFARWLLRYVTLARERGATPILVTPVARRVFDHGQLLDTHGVYGDAVRALARREKVALIDLQARSMDWLRALGDAASKPFYMHVPAQQQADDTHFQRHGAVAVACFVVDEWKRLDPHLAPHVVRDTDCGARATARADRDAQRAPSAIEHERDIAIEQPGPHGGAGITTAHPFFRDSGLPFALRKRVLHAGAGIGLHQHDKDEVYYIVSGRGLYILDGALHDVGAGDALLTRPGSTHAIRQVGDEDLVILLAYPHPATRPEAPTAR